MSITASSSLSSSTLSLLRTAPDKRPGSFYTLYNFPDFTLHNDGPGSPDTVDSGDTHQRYHVFGTPISQRGTPDESSTIASAYTEIGMDKMRDTRGGSIGSHSDRVAYYLRYILRSDEDEEKRPLARGGSGDTAWLLLDQPGTVVPEIPRRGSKQTESSLATNDGTNSERPEGEQEPVTPPSRRLSQHPREQARRGSIESKFREDLPKPRKGSNAVHWIRKRVRSISSDMRQTEAVFPKEKRKGKAPSISRKLTKRWSSVSVLAEATEPPSNLPPSESRRSEQNDSPPFLTLVDTALCATPPRQDSRFRKFSTELNHLVVSPVLRTLSRPSFETPTSPPRSSSAPPRNSIWELEFLPSEATGIKTPKEYPVYDPKRLGSQPMPRKREAEYFKLADMVQSQPPLAHANEPPSRLDPKETPPLSGSSVMHSFSEEDCRAIAPFMEQDYECNLPTSPIRTAIEVTGQKIRRASLQAKSFILPRKLSDVVETPSPSLVDPPRRIRSPKIMLNLFKRHDTWRRGQEDTAILPPPPPAEVLLERKKREKRDTGVIGLDPVEMYEDSTDDSFSYSSVMREIAGLQKYPKGSASKQARDKGLDLGGVGDLVTPPPPGWPVGVKAKGRVLQDEESAGGR
jgi:hypothetical protein